MNRGTLGLTEAQGFLELDRALNSLGMIWAKLGAKSSSELSDHMKIDGVGLERNDL